jgi:quinol monooxygenase YgiN
MDKMLIILTDVFFETPEELGRILALSQSMVAASRKEKGCVTYAYARDGVDPSIMRVIEVWQDEASHSAHTKSPHYAQYQAATAAAGAKVKSFTAQAYDGSNARPFVG